MSMGGMVSVRFRLLVKKLCRSRAAILDPAEVFQRVEPGQHPPESQDGDDRDSDDESQSDRDTQIISFEPSSGSDLKFSSRRTQVMQRISRKTISDGLNGASFRVPDTRCRTILA